MTATARIAIGIIVTLTSWVSHAQSLEVIELKYRQADEVIPILQPLIEPGGALSGRDYTLFVRTSATNLAQVRSALQQIDRKPKQFLVSVRRSADADVRRAGADVSGTVQTGRVTGSVNGSHVNEAERRSGVTVRGTQGDLQSSTGALSSVSVLEGSSAFIATGTSVPIVTAMAAAAGRRPWAAISTEYRDLTSGFIVTPRVSGAGVVLDIEQRDERLRNGTIQNQNLTTQVAAQVGEWVRLGGIDETSTTTQRGVLSRQYATNTQAQSVWVKVDLQ